MKTASALLLLLFASSFAADVVNYEGYKVIRTVPKNELQAGYLEDMQDDVRVSFWSHVRIGSAVDVMVGPDHLSEFVAGLDVTGIEHSVMVEDAQVLANQHKMVPAGQRTRSGKADHDMDWEDYHPIEDMYSYLQYLEDNYLDVSLETIGQSFEGVDMTVIKICRGGGGCDNGKPDMYIEGGIHAREWISPATVMWLIKELVEGSGAIGGEHEDLVDNLNWHILPVTNPDGYAYTQVDRYWRKTRSVNDGNTCDGVDPNRNWDYMWNTGGSSANSCSDAYMGPGPMSEVEMQNVDAYVMTLPYLVFFNDIHSYGQLALMPWGWTIENAPDYEDRVRVFTKGIEATAAVHGEIYTVISVTAQFGKASGGSVDYALGTALAKYSLAHELRDTGRFGFVLPPEYIVPTGEEIWAFHVAVARELINEYVP